MSEVNSPDEEASGGTPDEDALADGTTPSQAPPADPLEAARAEAQRTREQLLRIAADFDNFKKRSRKEMIDGVKLGREDLLRELLPVFDNLERASAHAETATDTKALADGIVLVQRQFTDTLGKLGVERVPSVGLPFDPAVHEAVQHLETSEYPPGVVAKELQAGYRSGERVIRPAMVVVAKAAPS